MTQYSLNNKNDKYLKLAVILSFLFIAYVCIDIYLDYFNHAILAYREGSLNWLHGINLYDRSGGGFIYFPTSAVFFIPFALSSLPIGEILWRIFSLALLITAFYSFAKVIAVNYHPHKVLLFLVGILIFAGFSSVRNGQFNIILLAMMLFTVTSMVNQRFWLAAIFLTLGIALKPTMLVFLLTLWVLFPQLWWRLPVCLGVGFILPFLAQHPTYVAAQYAQIFTMLDDVVKVGSADISWAQLFGLIGHFGSLLSRSAQNLIIFVGAVFTLGYCYFIKKKYPLPDKIVFIFVITTCYLLLFNPRSENTDYVLLVPAFGYFFVNTWRSKKWLSLVILTAIFFGKISSYYLAKALSTDYTPWFSPFMGICFTIFTIYQIKNYQNPKFLIKRQHV